MNKLDKDHNDHNDHKDHKDHKEEEEEEEEEENQDEINASFQRLLDLDLEEEMREVNCCIGCKTRVAMWMSFCGATCEKEFNEPTKPKDS